MISPFTHLNGAQMRAEARRRFRRRFIDLALLAALAATALIIGRSILTTALALDQLLIDAALRGSM